MVFCGVNLQYCAKVMQTIIVVYRAFKASLQIFASQGFQYLYGIKSFLMETSNSFPRIRSNLQHDYAKTDCQRECPAGTLYANTGWLPWGCNNISQRVKKVSFAPSLMTVFTCCLFLALAFLICSILSK